MRLRRRLGVVTLIGAVLAALTVSPSGAAPLTPPPVPERPLRVLAVGDSVQFMVALGFGAWDHGFPGRIEIHSDTIFGCGIPRFGFRRAPDVRHVGATYVEAIPARCNRWPDRLPVGTLDSSDVVSWPSALERWRPDVVVASPSAWDIVDRRVPFVLQPGWRWIGHPDVDAFYRIELDRAVRLLTSTGATLVWLRLPYVGRPVQPQSHPVRVDRLNALSERVLVDARVPHVVLDLPRFLGPVGAARDRAFRPDGLHYSVPGAVLVADWVTRRLLADGIGA